MAPICSYFMCNNAAGQKSMFRFPTTDPRRLNIWINNCGNMTITHLSRDALRNKYICIDHFDKKFLRNTDGKRKRITKLAVPIYYRWDTSTDFLSHSAAASISQDLEEAMAHNIKLADSDNYCNVKEEPVSDDNDHQLEPTEVLWLPTGAQQETFDQQTYKEELYAGHVVKEELVIGPDVLQQADSNVIKEEIDTDTLCPRMLQSAIEVEDNEKSSEIYKGIRQLTTMGLKTECNKTNKVDVIEMRNKENDEVGVKVNEMNNSEISNDIPESLNSLKDNTVNCEMNLVKHLICNECEYQTVSRERLKKHLRLHDTSRPFVCDSCGLRFNTKECVRNHINHNRQLVKDGCNICKYESKCRKITKTFLSCSQNNENHKTTCRSNRKKKLQMLMNNKSFSCKYCNYSFNQSSSLKIHLKKHTRDKPYACSYCTHSYSSQSYLIRHLRTHTGEKSYTCTHCNYSCIRRSYLKQHLRTHTGQKPYTCAYCNKSFSVKSHLIPHIRTHTGEKPYTCAHCNYSCTRSSHLKQHLRTHTGEKPYICAHCDYSCSGKFYLTQHLRTHTGEKPYTCAYCNNSFSAKSYLTRHLSTHTGENTYTCAYCNNSFSVKCYLIRHLKTHTGEKPYTCAYCNNSFSVKSYLTRHLRTHIGEKPYTCAYCNKSFSVKTYLIRHLRTHTGVKPYTRAYIRKGNRVPPKKS